MTEPLQPASPDALPTLTQVARVEGVSVPLIQPVRPPRGGRARWAIALVATLVVVLVAGGLVAFAGAGAASVGPAYAPSDALLYMDVRGDLPGDQRQQLATFMAHFPGFADPSSLQTKLDQALDKLVEQGHQRHVHVQRQHRAVVRRPGRGGRRAVGLGRRGRQRQ